MIVIGNHIDDNKGVVFLPEQDLLHHTAIMGQSGSGKSYHLTRLIEELALRNRARILILDPNGDFSNCNLPQPDNFWEENSEKLSKLHKLESKIVDGYETKTAFSSEWQKRRFQYITFNSGASSTVGETVLSNPLMMHWTDLDYEQEFFLDIDAKSHATLYQGYLTCVHYIKDFAKKEYPRGHSLEDLEELADCFANDKIAIGSFPSELKTLGAGAILTNADWNAVKLMLRDVRKRFNQVWHRGQLKGKLSIPASLPDHIKKGFDRNPWDICVLGMPGLRLDEMLLTANSAITEMSKCCMQRWTSVRRLEAAYYSQKSQPNAKAGGVGAR